ncbi:MAG TPA: hypothetical protein VK859_17285 [bacterium]|nr:hypothetical protein [bacterium]
MRQILLIDNLADQRFRPFFEKVFLTVGVGTVWHDYESIGSGKPTMESFKRDMGISDAVFLILNGEVQTLSKAKDWIFSESGFASDKDLWVFEHCEDLRRISIHIPAVKNYVAFYITNAWTDYVVKIAENLADSTAPAPPLLDAKLEPLAAPAIGSFFDDLTGMARFDYSTSRPMGIKTTCPYCTAAYQVHQPMDMKVFRCPVCNYFHEIKLPDKVPVPAVGKP